MDARKRLGEQEKSVRAALVRTAFKSRKSCFGYEQLHTENKVIQYESVVCFANVSIKVNLKYDLNLIYFQQILLICQANNSYTSVPQ